MKYRMEQGIRAAVLDACEKLNTVNDVLDCMVTATYEDCFGLIVPKECLPGDFFRLGTGLAGEILQKFSNYKMKIAVTGDFSGYTSKSLRDFIYECNQGRQVFFKATVEEGMSALIQASAR